MCVCVFLFSICRAKRSTNKNRSFAAGVRIKAYRKRPEFEEPMGKAQLFFWRGGGCTIVSYIKGRRGPLKQTMPLKGPQWHAHVLGGCHLRNCCDARAHNPLPPFSRPALALAVCVLATRFKHTRDAGNNPVLVAGNKVDLLPKDLKKLRVTQVREWIRKHDTPSGKHGTLHYSMVLY